MSPLIHDIKKLVSEVTSLPIDELNIDSQLVDYGFDSISLTRLANRIYAELALETTPAILIEYKTITDIARYLETLQAPTSTTKNTVSPPRTETETPPPHTSMPAYDDIFSASTPPPVAFAQDKKNRPGSQDIAVIGLSGEFAGATDPDALWELLYHGRSTITSPPAERNQLFVNEKAFSRGWPDYKTAFIDDIDKFDADFFTISPREARHLDPQQRLLLKHSWIALEEANCAIDDLAGKPVGVFIGISTADYRTIMESAGLFDSHYTTGIAHTMAANRISYFLGLTGPSVVIDTACSSSLVALHQAVNAINNGECDMAIVGAANAILHPGISHACMQAGMLSKSGACHTFDERADGYVRGEGCGVVVLKSMKQAAIDRDTVQAVIKGTATNHGGQVRSLTVPNSDAQADVILAALKQANLSPGDISYIEAHGTGTRIGDPVEINGLKHILQDTNLPDDFQCGIGSIKGNIGHLEAAAGMAGLIKTILMFRHRTLPANATFDKLNPYIDLQDSPYFIVDKTQPWETGGQPRRAGISSFGIGGSNAHVILQEPNTLPYSEDDTASTDNLWCLFSAPSQQQLQQHISDVIHYLQHHSDIPLARLADNLRRKKSHRQRLAIMASDTTELLNKLNSWLRQPEKTDEALSGTDSNTREFVRLSSSLGISAEELSEFFSSKKNITALINLWLSGLTVRWSSILPGRYQRIHLPCRPFNPQSYWIDLSASPSAEIAVPAQDLSPVAKPAAPQVKQGNITLSAPENYQPAAPVAPPASMIPNKIKLAEPNDTQPSYDREKPPLKASSLTTLKTLLSAVLGCPSQEVNGDKTFSEMGLDSILAVEFISKINHQFSLALNASQLYEHVNLYQLVDYIDGLVIPAEQTVSLQASPQPAEVTSLSIRLNTSTPPAAHNGINSQGEHATLINDLKVLLADTLGTEITQIDESKSFAEMGLDSILTVEFISKINRQFSLALNASQLYEHVNLHQLVHYIDGLVMPAGESLPVQTSSNPANTANIPGIPNSAIASTHHHGINPAVDQATARHGLKALLADTLGAEISQIDEDKSFAEMGLDSILGMDFISKVNRQFNSNLKAESLYEHVCLSRLLPYVTPSSPATDATESMDEVLRQVWQGTLTMDEADKRLSGRDDA